MNEFQIAPFLKYSSTHRRSDTPSISIAIQLLNGSDTIAKTGKDGILITLTRAHDGHDQPCIFYWSGSRDGFASDGFLLLHRAADDQLEKIEVSSHDGPRPEAPIKDKISPWDHHIRELTPGASDRFYQKIPQRYRDALVPGERYELVWAGGEVCWWAWGTIQQHEGQPRDYKPPSLVCPGGSYLSFTAIAEQPLSLRQPSPPPTRSSTRIPETPALSVTLTGPNQKHLNKGFMVDFTLTYHGVANEDGEITAVETWPITIDTDALFYTNSSDRLYRRNENGRWENSANDEICGGGIADEDIHINIKESESFASLIPGDTWTTSYSLVDQLPDDEVVGDAFLYRFQGTTIEWWDWGNKDTYASPVVTLRSWISGGGFDPPGNSLKLVVPASNDVEFTIVE